MSDPQRQRRISEGAKQHTTQPQGTAPVAPVVQHVMGIIRSIDYEQKKMRWQRIAYKSNPPKEGELEAFGPIEDGYPVESAKVIHYAQWVWPGEPSENCLPIEAWKRKGAWILHIYMKVRSSKLDPNTAPSGCSRG